MPVSNGFTTGITSKPNMSDGDMFASKNGISYQGKEMEKKVEGELSDEELKLLERFRNGDMGFNEMQKEVAIRVFEKILKNPESIKVKDWLQSELVKIKKEESQAKIGALETFVRKLFSGNLPTHCTKCGSALFLEGEVIQNHAEPELNPGVFQE